MPFSSYFLFPGAADSSEADASLAHLAKTEVCLTLTNKFAISSKQKLDMDRLFVKTKQLIMMILPCSQGDNLIGCLKSKTLPFHEEKYWELVEKKEKVDATALVNASMIDHTNLFMVSLVPWFV